MFNKIIESMSDTRKESSMIYVKFGCLLTMYSEIHFMSEYEHLKKKSLKINENV